MEANRRGILYALLIFGIENEGAKVLMQISQPTKRQMQPLNNACRALKVNVDYCITPFMSRATHEVVKYHSILPQLRCSPSQRSRRGCRHVRPCWLGKVGMESFFISLHTSLAPHLRK